MAGDQAPGGQAEEILAAAAHAKKSPAAVRSGARFPVLVFITSGAMFASQPGRVQYLGLQHERAARRTALYSRRRSFSRKHPPSAAVLCGR